MVDKLESNNVEDILALTSMQQGMLFHYLKEPDSEQYFQQSIFHISGYISLETFQKSWDLVAKGNEMLRTMYRWEGLKIPVQVVLKRYSIPVRAHDFSNYKADEGQRAIQRIIALDKKEKVNICLQPFRVTLCKLGANEYKMIITNHHILYDGWSIGIILKEFLYYFDSICIGEEPGVLLKTKFKEHIRYCQHRDKDKQFNYWRDYLQGFARKTPLPYDLNNNEEIKEAENHICSINKTLMEKICLFSRSINITSASIFYSGWGILLQKYSYLDDVVFGATSSGRITEIKGVEEIVGLFINTLPLRITVKPDEYIKDILLKVDNDLKSREEFICTPLTYVKSLSGIENNDNLFESLVVIRNYPLDKTLDQTGHKLKVTLDSFAEMANFALIIVVSIFEGFQDINGVYMRFNKALFNKETVKKIGNHYVEILEQLIQHGCQVKDIGITIENLQLGSSMPISDTDFNF